MLVYVCFLYDGAYNTLKDFIFQLETLEEHTIYMRSTKCIEFMCNFLTLVICTMVFMQEKWSSFLSWQKSWTQFVFSRMVKRSYWSIVKHFSAVLLFQFQHSMSCASPFMVQKRKKDCPHKWNANWKQLQFFKANACTRTVLFHSSQRFQLFR